MILRAEGVGKQYFRKTGEANHFYAVNEIDLSLEMGKLTVIMGRSGSGKTTLLHMLAGLLTPTKGRVLLDEKDLYALTDGELSRVRNGCFGVVPQGRSAIDSLTVMENILLPRGMYGQDAMEQEAEKWLERLGVSSLRDAMPRQLSGGELRRMAIVRALCAAPPVILADEPTGDLDDDNTRIALSAFREAADRGAAVLLVTHEDQALQYADAAYRMNAGRLERNK